MAKARFLTTFSRNIPKLVFREHGEAKTDGARSGAIREKEVMKYLPAYTPYFYTILSFKYYDRGDNYYTCILFQDVGYTKC